MIGLLMGQCHLNGHLFKLRLVNSPKCEKCKWASKIASHFLCDCEAFNTLRFKHLGCHFLKAGDFEDIDVNSIMHFLQSARLLNA